MSDWITDRQPTKEDGESYDVWVTDAEGDVELYYWGDVPKGMPWQPIPKPDPYVKLKRWTVEWNTEWSTWSINDSHHKARFDFVLRGLNIDQGDVAQRIEDLFNEEMP